MKDNQIVTVLQQLQERGLIAPEQLAMLGEEARLGAKSILDLIEEKHLVDSEQLVELTATAMSMPYVNLVGQDISGAVLDLIEHDIAANYRLAPFAQEGSMVSVAMENPHDFNAVEALDFIARNKQVQMRYYLASSGSVNWVLKQYESLTQEVSDALQTGDSVDLFAEQTEVAGEEDAQAAPVSKTVSVILRYAVEGHASDVHIEPMDDGTRVRYRVDGELHTSLQVPKNIHNALVARIKVLANLKLDETRLPQDGRFRMRIDAHDVDFRVSTLPLIGQEKVVLRILDQESGLLSLDKLGFVGHNLELVEEHLKRPHGMILMTGPTGSGKSTSLYSMLQLLNMEERNIVTLEDPVEYNIVGVGQSQVHPDIGLTFAKGLRSILRQDPDIIMVGEIRDNETAELAIHAALTGHMLLSTLHTNDALGAVPRLIDMGVEQFLIASALNMVVAQRLVRKLCTECKIPSLLPVSLESEVMSELERLPVESRPRDLKITLPLTVYAPGECSACEDGFKGRLAILEVIEVTDRLESLISSSGLHDSDLVDEELHRQGMISMRQDGIMKAIRGETSIEEVWTVTKE